MNKVAEHYVGLYYHQDAADELADMVAMTIEEAHKKGYRMAALEHALRAYRAAVSDGGSGQEMLALRPDPADARSAASEGPLTK